MINKFYLNKVFPETHEIFSFEYKNFEQIKNSCIYVFDTNILFIPFYITKKGLSDYQAIFSKIKNQKRLYIPGHVSREFAKNRGDVIKTIFRKLNESKQNISNFNSKLDSLPILEENEDYLNIKKIEKEIAELKEKYKDNIDNLSDHVKSWNWNDPVSSFYKKFWTKDMIFDLDVDEGEISTDLEFRINHKIAPGYNDSNKLDNGIGDLIIWKTILEIGKKRKQDVVFVTDDAKNDWFYSEFNTVLYPKFELFDEFRRSTNGKTISIINFEKFLVSQDAKAETIEELKEIKTEKGFLIISRDVFISELDRSLNIAKDKGGFVSSKFFVETWLAKQSFDIGNSWELFNKLTREGVIETYLHEDPRGEYPPTLAVRMCIRE
jgi:hypothetical protein